MNPNDDDRQYDDDVNSHLFPNAGQRFSHNFYGDPVDAPPQQNFEQSENNDLDEYCPQCDARLEIRESTLGKYIACTRFPDCRYTRPYAESDYVEEEVSDEELSTAEENTEDTDDDAAPTAHNEYDHEDPVEKDYLKEAANELSGYGYHDEPDNFSQAYDEPEQTRNESKDYDEPKQEDTTNAYYDEEVPESEPQTEPSFEPSIYGKPLSEENAVTPEPIEEPKQEEQKPRISLYPKKQPLRLHPGFLKENVVSNSAKWAELKQKRLRDQKLAALTPEEAAAAFDMPSPEELAETLKKLEENVQKLQNEEGQQLADNPQKQSQPANHDEYDDDILPPSLRQALKEKTTNDY